MSTIIKQSLGICKGCDFCYTPPCCAGSPRELGAGLSTLRDIYQALRKPGRDPREDVAEPVFRSDLLRLEDLVSLRGDGETTSKLPAFVPALQPPG